MKNTLWVTQNSFAGQMQPVGQGLGSSDIEVDYIEIDNRLLL